MTKVKCLPTYVAIVLGSLIVFIWSSLSWTVFPFHQWTFKSFTHPNAVVRVIEQNARESGVYMIPSCENHGDVEDGPLILSAVRLEGINPNMGKEIAFHFLNILIGTALIGALLKKCAPSLRRYGARVLFVLLFAFAGALLNQVPLWNWHFFSASFVFMGILDQVVGFFLAGLVMAAMIKVREESGIN
ncbi:MAG: hypothetical protein KDK76_02685 [Chlamydiia bacterium]|nr:hypothetical protein [Chlamydiia bacterium]